MVTLRNPPAQHGQVVARLMPSHWSTCHLALFFKKNSCTPCMCRNFAGRFAVAARTNKIAHNILSTWPLTPSLPAPRQGYVLGCDTPAALARSARILLQLASALQYLHESGIVHGDIKRENVLLQPDVQRPGEFMAKVRDVAVAPASSERIATLVRMWLINLWYSNSSSIQLNDK